MQHEEIARHLRHQPFNPFRIFLSDGAVLRINKPHHTLLVGDTLAIGHDIGDSDMPQRAVYVDIQHVNRLEPLREKISVPEEPGDDGSGENGRP